MNIGDKSIIAYFLGKMGIFEAYLGEELLYRRKSSYLYLELNTKGV